MEMSELKRQLQRGRARRRYPREVRDAVVAHAEREKHRGRTYEQIASDLGVCVQTLAYWRSTAPSDGTLETVTIVPEHDAPARQEVIVEFGPLRVRGLDVSGVAELMRRLG